MLPKELAETVAWHILGADHPHIYTDDFLDALSTELGCYFPSPLADPVTAIAGA